MARSFLSLWGSCFGGGLAFASRLSWDAALQLREKKRMHSAFGSYVSPQIMTEIVAGRLQPGLGGERRSLCVMFVDIRDFTTRSEGMLPEQLIALLNRYFSEMTQAIHRNGGTLDKFIGDGIMAFFGAPQVLDCPERNALEAAQEMLLRLQRLNERLKTEGIVPIRIGIGLHIGDAIVGHVGSESRHEYTAIGDAVNVASRLEGLSKTVGYPVVCSAEVVAGVGNIDHFVDLGEHPVKGHTAVKVFGWAPKVLE